MRRLGADGIDLLDADVRDTAAWDARLERDRVRVRELLTPELMRATQVVRSQAIVAGAEAVALTGSTVRGRRTQISDLDVHIVGVRPDLTDVAVELDVYATTVGVMWERLRAGDDYVQWTLRFGCVLFDTGVLHAAAVEAVATGMWPSPERKRTQARRMLAVADAVVASRDHDAAVEQTRSALTAVARWILLGTGHFPLSRDELPDQLRGIGNDDVALALECCIHGEPALDQLAGGVRLGRGLVDSAAAVVDVPALH